MHLIDRHKIFTVNFKEAQAMLVLGNDAQAYEMLKQAKNVYRTNAPVRALLAKACMRINKPWKAMKHISKAILIDPFEEDYYTFRAEIHEELGFKDRALDDVESALLVHDLGDYDDYTRIM